MRPHFCSFMAGATAWQQKIVPIRLRSRVRRRSSSDAREAKLSGDVPRSSPGVVDEDIDTSEISQSLFHHGLHLILLADIGFNPHGSDAQSPAFVHHRWGGNGFVEFRMRFRINIVDNDVRPELGQTQGMSPTDAPGCACDQGDFPFEFHFILLFKMFMCNYRISLYFPQADLDHPCFAQRILETFQLVPMV